jgi:type IV secretion system protein VirB10
MDAKQRGANDRCGAHQQRAAIMTEKEEQRVRMDTDKFRLQGERPPVMRLSRKALIGLGAISAIALAGVLGYALHTSHKGPANPEPPNASTRPAAEGIANLPKDYRGLPHQAPPLGSPLPGDLGKPLLHAGITPSTAPSAGTPETQRLTQETDGARISRLFAQTNQQPQSVGVVPTVPNGETSVLPAAPIDAGAAQNMQDRKTAFLNAAPDRRTISPDRLQPPASPYIVQAGTVIPAALITGIRSDLPGQITAQVTQAVFDTPSGRFLLIPAGAKLIGQYDSSVAFEQRRVLLVWTRLIMLDGTSITLERQPGADTQGYAGLEDEVDYHWRELVKASVLSTILSVGAEAGTSNSENNLVQAIRMGASNSISQTGQEIVQRELNVQPTLTIRTGFPVRVIVTRDLVLTPYAVKGTP